MRHWLKEYRIIKNLSQKDMSIEVKITQQFYNYIENGHRRPSPEVAQKIASVLDFDWKLFYEGNIMERKKPDERVTSISKQ